MTESASNEKNQRFIGSYSFDSDAAIARADVEKGTNGGSQLVLFAAKDADISTLRHIPRALASVGAFGAYPDVRDGHNVLVVPNVQKHEEIVQQFPAMGLSKKFGVYEEAEKEKGNPISNLFNFAKHHTLEAAGWAGVLGYSGLAVDGVLRDDRTLQLSGIAALAPLVLMVYGSGDKSAEMGHLAKEMRKSLNEQGLELPAFNTVEEKKNFLGKLDQFMREHPVEISYTLANIGAVFLLATGLKEFKEEGKWQKLAISTSTIVGNLIVALVPEKHVDKEKLSPEELEEFENRNILQKLYGLVQASPLATHMVLNLVDIVGWSTEAKHDFTKHGKETQLKEFGTKFDELKEKLGIAQNNYNALNVAENINHTELSNVSEEISSLAGRLADTQKNINYLDTNSQLAQKFLGMNKADISGYLKVGIAIAMSAQIILGGISHKSKSPDEQMAEFEQLFASSAGMLSQMPSEARELVLEKMVTYLAASDVLQTAGLQPEQIKEQIASRAEVMASSPWLISDERIAMLERSFAKEASVDTIPEAEKLQPEMQISDSLRQGRVMPQQEIAQAAMV